CWYFVFLLPATAIMYIHERLFFEHRQYLPATGLFLALTQLRPLRSIDLRRWQTAVILGLLLTALGLQTYFYSLTFINRNVFWKTAMITSPRSAMSNAGYGRLLAYQGDLLRARDQMLEAIRLEPDNPTFYITFRDVQRQLNYDEKRKNHTINQMKNNKAVLRQPPCILELAIKQHREWRLDEAITLYRLYLSAKPHDARAHYLLGLALVLQDQWDQAAINYRRALVLGLPGGDRALAWYSLSDIYIRWGMLSEAKEARDSSRVQQ
ncbi:MAG: hypothetical protein QME74_11665, partial [Candidatus Edwardsbacteria bacterium]|nr:hypothetical protein [Candidatus Edwardsbacteria bacterium]